jgi:hypothetical protein
MDTKRFDALTRKLFADPSRRGLLRPVLGSVVALAGAAGVGFPVADARKRKKKKKKCKGGKKRCGKQCIPSENCCSAADCGGQRCCGGTCAGCCTDADCGAGGTCVAGACVCPAEKALCGGTCVDLATDGANCGACGTACDTNGCVNGFCTCQSQDECNGCVCALRLEDNETACSGDLTAQSCNADADCPARSFCRQTGGGNFCTEPCAV